MKGWGEGEVRAELCASEERWRDEVAPSISTTRYPHPTARLSNTPSPLRLTSPLHLPYDTSTCSLTLFPAYYLTFRAPSETHHSGTLSTSPLNIRPTPTSTLHLLFTPSPPLQHVHMPFPILHHLLPIHTTHTLPTSPSNVRPTPTSPLRYAHLPFHLPPYTSATHTTRTYVSA